LTLIVHQSLVTGWFPRYLNICELYHRNSFAFEAWT